MNLVLLFDKTSTFDNSGEPFDELLTTSFVFRRFRVMSCAVSVLCFAAFPRYVIRRG